jgi:hypothetical protein
MNEISYLKFQSMFSPAILNEGRLTKWQVCSGITGFLETLRKLDLFPSSCDGRETTTPLGPIKGANLNH